jgi:beta-lactamase class A
VLGLGVALMEPGLSWVSDATARFPLQSVFKAIMAAAALSELDAGRLRLNEPITITDLDLSPPFSLIDQAWPTPPAGHAMTLPVADLLALAVQRSDNTAADNLMKRIGGPGAVNAWLRAKNITDISIDRYERELQPELAGMNPFQPAWKDQNVWSAVREQVPAAAREAATARYLHDPRDTATLPATLDFLVKLTLGQLISPASTHLLLRLMTTSVPGASRIKAGLPPGASVAHKTGSAATDVGLTPATNDIGVVTLADGRRFAIAAYLAGSTATAANRDKLIADGARLACGSVS